MKKKFTFLLNMQMHYLWYSGLYMEHGLKPVVVSRVVERRERSYSQGYGGGQASNCQHLLQQRNILLAKRYAMYCCYNYRCPEKEGVYGSLSHTMSHSIIPNPMTWVLKRIVSMGTHTIVLGGQNNSLEHAICPLHAYQPSRFNRESHDLKGVTPPPRSWGRNSRFSKIRKFKKFFF